MDIHLFIETATLRVCPMLLHHYLYHYFFNISALSQHHLYLYLYRYQATNTLLIESTTQVLSDSKVRNIYFLVFFCLLPCSFVVFYILLFCFVLFCFVLFCFVLPRTFLLYSVFILFFLFSSVLFCFVYILFISYCFVCQELVYAPLLLLANKMCRMQGDKITSILLTLSPFFSAILPNLLPSPPHLSL